MSNKTIYILLATYNGEKYLKEQINSLFSQTYQNWVLWIHDDNSVDKTVTIIKEYQQKYSNKIIFIDDNISTGGAKENFTYLLNNIDEKYDYVMFCDQDDVWLNNKIAITLQNMIELENQYPNKPILVHSDLQIVDNQLNTLHKSFINHEGYNINWSKDLKISLVQNIVAGCTAMINKKTKNISLPIMKQATMHDGWILLKVLRNNGIVKCINQSTIKYRQHSNNHTGAEKVSMLKFIKNIKSLWEYKAMANAIDIKISTISIICIKIKILFYRLQKHKGNK